MFQQENPWGLRLRQRRTALRQTQEEVAEIMKVSALTIKNWENQGVPKNLASIIDYLFEFLEPRDEQVHQLPLPFEGPVNLELRISPHKADTVRIAVQWRDKAAG